MSIKEKKIKIVGAGFSGLTLAYYLSKKGFEIDIFDKKEKAGGLLQSISHQKGIVETAANGVLETELVQQLFSDINLPIISANQESKKRYLYINEKFSRWPLSIFETLRLIYGLILMKLKIGAPKDNEKVQHWAAKQLGIGASKKLVSPALQGIYAEDGSVLSAKLLFSRFFTKKRFKGGKKLISAKNGMGDLSRCLVEYLKQRKTRFHFSTTIKKDQFNDTFVFAGSLNQAKEFDPSFFDKFNLKTNNVTSITVFINDKAPLDGFGALFPRDQKIDALGVLINNKIFNHRVKEGSSLTFIYKDIHKFTDQEIIHLIIEDCKKCFHLKLDIRDFNITHWEKSLPVYDNNLEQFLNSGQHYDCDYYRTGNYLGKLGLTGILEQNFLLAEQIDKDFT